MTSRSCVVSRAKNARGVLKIGVSSSHVPARVPSGLTAMLSAVLRTSSADAPWHIIPANEYNQFYLETKAARSGHLIDFDGHEHLLEQIDRPVVEGMDSEAVEAIERLDTVETRA